MSLLLVGAGGMLAVDLLAILRESGREVLPLSEEELDVTDRRAVAETIGRRRPEAVLNCAAYTLVDRCEEEEKEALAVNGRAVENLAEACREAGIQLVHFSTDYVFDGKKGEPYVEEDPPNPLGAYGRTKLEGERAAREVCPGSLVIRTSWLYGAAGSSFPKTIARLAAEREKISVVADQVGRPTYTVDLARATAALLDAGAAGLFHVAGSGLCSWREFAERIVGSLRRRGAPVKCRKVNPISTEKFGAPAPRPPYSVLSTEKYFKATGLTPPHWEESLERFLDELFGPPG